MPAISKVIVPDVVAARVKYGDETVSFQFDNSRVTSAWAARTHQLIAENDVLVAAKAMSEVMVSWDLLEDDEQTPYPLTVETLSGLPTKLMGKMMEALNEAAVPGEAEGKASSVPTSTQPLVSTEPPQTSLNGPATSPSPVPSASPSPT